MEENRVRRSLPLPGTAVRIIAFELEQQYGLLNVSGPQGLDMSRFWKNGMNPGGRGASLAPESAEWFQSPQFEHFVK